ncbi:hypothetical protein E2P81_ATG10925 [Venturia nashicola]|nr:hypothetical protein E2P81_ATG10925 [Venturia nashicola]
MDVLLDNFGVASHKFVQFLRDYHGHFKEFQQAVDKVSDFASAHHGDFAASNGLTALIGYAHGSHADHARLTAEKIPGMIELYRSQLHRDGTNMKAATTYQESDEIDRTTTTSRNASPRTPLSRNPLGGTSTNASPFASTSKTPRSQASGTPSVASPSATSQFTLVSDSPVLKYGSRFLETSGGQIDQEALLMLRFKHSKNKKEDFSYKIDSPEHWKNKKMVEHAQKMAQQYVTRKCGIVRDKKRPSYHPEDTKWITDYMTAKLKLTKAEAGGFEWVRLSQSSHAIKQITADYNARDCVVNGDRTSRTEMAVFQKISRVPEIRLLREMHGLPKKRKFRNNTEESEGEADEASPPGSATKKTKSARDSTLDDEYLSSEVEEE